MSLITDLLSKIRQVKQERDVLPGLRDAVFQAEAKRQLRKKLALSFFLLIVIVGAGYGVIYFAGYIIKDPLSLSGGVKSTVSQAQLAPSVTTISSIGPRLEETSPQSVKRDMSASLSKEPEVKKPDVDMGKKRHQEKTKVSHYVAASQTRKEKATGIAKIEPGSTQDRINKQEKEAFLYAARTNEMQGNYRQALSNYKRVLVIEPMNFVVLNNIAGALIHMGKFHDSLQYARKAIALKRDYVPALINMGIACSQMGKHKESEVNLQRAYSLEPANPYVLLNLGILYEKKENFARAQEYYTILSREGDPRGYVGLARIAEREKKITDAVNYYNLVMSMENTDVQTRAFVEGRLRQLVR